MIMTKDIMEGVILNKNQCIVAMDDAGNGHIVAVSNEYRDTDVFCGDDTYDNGFNDNWNKGLSVGLYLVTCKPWSNKDYDSGIDVIKVEPLWTIDQMKYPKVPVPSVIMLPDEQQEDFNHET